MRLWGVEVQRYGLVGQSGKIPCLKDLLIIAVVELHSHSSTLKKCVLLAYERNVQTWDKSSPYFYHRYITVIVLLIF